MRRRLRVVPTAQRHIRVAAKWWRDNRPAAPGLFGEELEHAFDLITLQPGIGPRVPDFPEQSIYRFHLSRVQYHLYYRVRVDLVEILAVWHTSRGSPPRL